MINGIRPFTGRVPFFLFKLSKEGQSEYAGQFRNKDKIRRNEHVSESRYES